MSKEERYPLVSQDPRLMQAYVQEDEISLVDLWLVLARRRRIIFTVLVLCLLLGLAFLFILPRKYEYSTAVEIGTTLVKDGNGERTELIDPPETVLAKINESYIPWVQNRYYQSHPDDEALYRLEADIPKKSQIIVIKGKGPAKDEAVYLEQLNGVLQRLFKDHGRQTAIVRSNLQARLARTRNQLAALEDPATLAVKKKSLENELNAQRIHLEELRDPRIMRLKVQALETELEQKKKAVAGLRDQAKLLQAQYKRLDQVDALLKKQIADLQAEIDTALAQRRKTVGKVEDAGMAMAMLMIDNEIQKNRSRLAGLEERYFIEQKNARETLLNKIEDNRRQQEVVGKVIQRLKGELDKLKYDNEREQARLVPKIALTEEKIRKLVADHQREIDNQKEAVRVLETHLANIKETRALIEPVRSMEPVGPGGKVILALAGVLGLMLGVFAAFGAEFLAKVRERSREAGRSSGPAEASSHPPAQKVA